MLRALSRVRLSAAAVTVGVALTALVPLTTSVADAAGAATPTVKPVVAGSRYLALGDSVVFGFREQDNLPTPDYAKPKSFRGYPEDLARSLGLRLTNAGCPGETSASFINATAQSNGCENSWDKTSGTSVPAGYRTLHPLHVAYSGSQLAFAVHFLKAHPGTRLVTLTLGANDGFLCQAQTTDGCLGELNQLLTAVRAHYAHILKRLRGAAGYTGQLVVLNYYSFDYSDPILTAEINLLNNAIADASSAYHVKIVSGYAAFKHASAQASGDVCAAQLITTLTSGGCGVHPSVAGAAVLAQQIAQHIKKR